MKVVPQQDTSKYEPKVPSAATEDLQKTLDEIQNIEPAPTPPIDPQPAKVETTEKPDPTPAPEPGPQSDQTPMQEGLQVVNKTPQADEAQEVWQQKYRSEVPRLHSFLKDKDAEIAALKAQLEKAPTDGTPPEKAPDKKEFDIDAYLASIPESTKEDLGSENIANILKAVTPQNSPNPDVEELKSYVKAQQSERFYSELDRIVPQWEAIGQSDEFKSFCGNVDSLTGQRYQDILDNAVASGDTMRVTEIFSRFNSSTPSKSADIRPSLQEQVIPDGRPTPLDTSNLQSIKRAYTLSEWENGMTRVASKTNLNPSQATELEKELKSAMLEGRVLDNGSAMIGGVS